MFRDYPGGVGPIYDWPKLLLWKLKAEKVVYLDADTLPLAPGMPKMLINQQKTPANGMSGALEPLFGALEHADFAAVAFAGGHGVLRPRPRLVS